MLHFCTLFDNLTRPKHVKFDPFSFEKAFLARSTTLVTFLEPWFKHVDYRGKKEKGSVDSSRELGQTDLVQYFVYFYFMEFWCKFFGVYS
jgi:hypothetical protein